MSWAKIDDLLPHHRKLLDAGGQAPAVFGLYVASICYAQRQKTDGHVPRQALALILPGCPKPSKRLLELLVHLHLWDVDGDGWRVHDFLEHNLSTAQRSTKASRAAHARWDAQPMPSGMPNPCSTDASSSPLLSSPKPNHSSPKASADGFQPLGAEYDRLKAKIGRAVP